MLALFEAVHRDKVANFIAGYCYLQAKKHDATIKLVTSLRRTTSKTLLKIAISSNFLLDQKKLTLRNQRISRIRSR